MGQERLSLGYAEVKQVVPKPLMKKGVYTVNILVVSSCTKSKRDCRAVAAEMYTGGQIRYLMQGLDMVRSKYGGQTIDLEIISAKYGLINEFTVISPYDDTYSGLKKREILERSKSLHIHDQTQALIVNYDLVFFLLGKEYVWSLQLPFAVPDTVTQIFLAGNNSRDCIPDNAHFILASLDLAKQVGVMNIDLKGFVFKKLCAVVCDRGLEVFETIKQDPQSLLNRTGLI